MVDARIQVSFFMFLLCGVCDVWWNELMLMGALGCVGDFEGFEFCDVGWGVTLCSGGEIGVVRIDIIYPFAFASSKATS